MSLTDYLGLTTDKNNYETITPKTTSKNLCFSTRSE